jgi:hypothetical protein
MAFVQNEPVFSAMKSAESKLKEFRLAESEDLENALFATIFGNKNLLKFAQEEMSEEEPQEPQEAPVAPETAVEPAIDETQTQPTNEQPTSSDEDGMLNAAAEMFASAIADSMSEAGIKSDSGETFADILNYVLATSSKSTRIAVDVLKEVATSDELAETGAAQRGESLTGFEILTPDQASRAEGLWRNLVSTGALNMEPPWIPGAAQRNFQKQLLIEEFTNQMGMSANAPTEVMNKFLRSGLEPGAIPSSYLQLLREMGFSPELTQ